MIFLGIAIPIGILLGLLLFFSGLYNRNRLAAAASGGLDMFTTNFENQLDSVENYLLNLSLNDATFRSLSEQTDRTRAYLDAYEIAQGFPAVLAANDVLMGVVLRSGSGNLYVGRYGAAAQQLKQKLNLEAYLGQPGQTNKMMTKGWYLRTIGLLTILAELISDTVNWAMNSRAAELLAGSGYTVDTGFHISYAMIIMGILILFAAEVFAIGQNLSEEQKYTI